MGDSSNSSGSGSSDDGGGRGSEWEVVSLSLSSHSLLSASTSLDTTGGGAATGTGNGGGDAPFATALNSAYFLCSPKASSPEAPLNQRPSSSNVEEEEEGELLSSIPEPDADADETKKKKTKEEQMAVASEVPAELLGAEESLPLATTTKEVSQQQEEEEDVEQQHRQHGRDALFPVARSWASRMQELSGTDWLEPMAPAVDYEQDEMGSASILYGLSSDSKAVGAEPDFGGQAAAGPLLGSCLSSPSSPTIVSRTNSMRLVLGEEAFEGQVLDGGDDGSELPPPLAACLVEAEDVPSLAGLLEREIFRVDPGFEFVPDSGVAAAGVDDGQKKMEAEEEEDGDTQKSAPFVGDGCCDDEQQTYEAWWKRQAVLWCMQARQANTLWSIALAVTVMGLVILGHRWQHERCQNQQLRLQLCSKDEKISQLVFQIARLKEALSGRRRVPVLRTSSSFSSFLDRL
ncbi:hypothetical protein CY35_01G038300 [Sphagnum magellanicum]|nr:hypothetical protein CY35_01G038300 [Sphagnum magellanicum]